MINIRMNCRLMFRTRNVHMAQNKYLWTPMSSIPALLLTHYLENQKLFNQGVRHVGMAWRYDNNGPPPRKMTRVNGSALPPPPQMMFHPFGDYRGPAFRMDPPPPPPILMNCGEIREHHHGSLVEMDGKVNRTRMGRFIELKDQYGITQLVAPLDNINVSKRFANMPLESFITIIGMVKRRPENLKNTTIPTGGIEVHVEDIIRVQKTFKGSRNRDSFGNNKRNYSTMTGNGYRGGDTIVTAMTSSEYKRAAGSETLIKWFSNREQSCGSLRLRDASKVVSLVGWTDKKTAKFIHLYDGYGHTQVIIDNEDVKAVLNTSAENDIFLITGRVVARPQTHVTHSSNTGEIELFADSIRILGPNDEYDGPIREIVTDAQTNEETALSKQTEVSTPPTTPKINDYTFRTHSCGELRDSHVGTEVVLCGWLEFTRMNKFFTLRDGYGHVQVIIPPDLQSLNIDCIPLESILKVQGVVMLRPPKMQNARMATGAIEVLLSTCEILNPSLADLPIQVRSFNRANEPNRMEHRYIDLRFADMQYNLRTRSDVLMKMRDYLINYAGFVDVETPTLFRRTPGGAQEFVVPSRKAGYFYSLVQSPQQFKQMLMSGAIDRYFQIARCYRDETSKIDRQPEFTQLDIELSFTDAESIYSLVENILKHCWPIDNGDVKTPFQRMTYEEVMSQYGTDKPDTRINVLTFNNVSEVLTANENLLKDYPDFGAYAIVLQDKFKNYPSSLKQDLLSLASSTKSAKLLISKVNTELDEWVSNGLQPFSADITRSLATKLNLNIKDTVILTYGKKSSAQILLGKIRKDLIDFYMSRDVIPKVTERPLNFLWIYDFPLFTFNEDTNQLETTHHPFTAPHPDDADQLTSQTNLEKIRSLAYDLVLNGQEIGGGSIRIHNAQLQRMVLNDILKLNSEHLEHMLTALETGCPPHGGIALGIDRLLSIICQTASIREVIAFPKGNRGNDPLSKAPYKISQEDLDLYHLKITGSEEPQSNDTDVPDDLPDSEADLIVKC